MDMMCNGTRMKLKYCRIMKPFAVDMNGYSKSSSLGIVSIEYCFAVFTAAVLVSEVSGRGLVVDSIAHVPRLSSSILWLSLRGCPLSCTLI